MAKKSMQGNVKKPKWPVPRAIESGNAGLVIYRAYQARLDPRLPAGYGDRLAGAVATLEGARGGKITAYLDQKSLTKGQNALLSQAARLVSEIREAVRRGAPADSRLQKACGIGERLNPALVPSVVAGLAAIVKAGETYKDQLFAAGLLDKELGEAKELAQALAGVDATQESAKSTARLSTAARDRARLVVEEAIDRLIAAGLLEFRGSPEIQARFAALVPGKAGAKAAPAAPAPQA